MGVLKRLQPVLTKLVWFTWSLPTSGEYLHYSGHLRFDDRCLGLDLVVHANIPLANGTVGTHASPFSQINVGRIDPHETPGAMFDDSNGY